MNELMLCGAIGTVVSAMGVTQVFISVEDTQRIVATAISVLGFLISVLIPFIIRLFKKIKAALSDKKITKDELKEICSEIKNFLKDFGEQSTTIKEEVKGEISKEPDPIPIEVKEETPVIITEEIPHDKN